MIAIATDVIKPYNYIQYSKVQGDPIWRRVENYKGGDRKDIIGMYVYSFDRFPTGEYPVYDATKGERIEYRGVNYD